MLDIRRVNTFKKQKSLGLVIFLLLFGLTSSLKSQETLDSTSSEKVLVENADNSIQEVIDGDHIQYLRSNVRLIHDSIYMFCDSARIKKEELIAVGEVIIIQDDTIQLFSDSLVYDSQLKKAEMYFNVVLKNGNKRLFTEKLIYNLEDKKAIFNDTTTLVDGTMQLSSLRGIYNVQKRLAKFYDEVTIIDGDFNLKSDSLLYDTDIDRAYFLGPTYITQGGDKVYCEAGYYDMKVKRAFFSGNSKMYNSDQSALGDNINYYGADSLFVISGNAVVEDSTSIAKGDVITKNSKTKTVLIEGNGYYKSGDRVIVGPYILYDEKTESLVLEERSTVKSETGEIIGDSISYDKVKDYGVAVGTAIWRDTVQDIVVESDRFEYKEKESFYKAIVDNQRPLFRQFVDGDTLYLSADTLISGAIGDSVNYLKAIRSVEIFKSDLQAVCDSLYYDDIDSTFVLFDNPISWSDTTQILGDTLSIKLKNEKVSDIIASQNAFIASVDEGGYYNQIKGRLIHSFLDSNTLTHMSVKGNAESLYFLKDSEKKYIGPNYTACSHMVFYFANKEIDKINFFTEPSSKMTPMKRATESQFKLSGFAWNASVRPKSWESLRLIKSGNSNLPKERSKDVFEEKVNDVIFKTAKEGKLGKGSKEKKPKKGR